MDIAAIALGANMVEKTITLDRATPSVEHLFSIEPDEMKAFVSSVRNLETALGSTRRRLGPEERDRGVGTRRCIVLKQDVKKDQIIDDFVIDYVRPGTGIFPETADVITKRKFTKDLTAGTVLAWGDFS